MLGPANHPPLLLVKREVTAAMRDTADQLTEMADALRAEAAWIDEYARPDRGSGQNYLALSCANRTTELRALCARIRGALDFTGR